MRIGDIVRHNPSGESWLVAKVCENGDVIASGWPCTWGKASDVQLIESCSDHDHQVMMCRLAELPKSDPRSVAL